MAPISIFSLYILERIIGLLYFYEIFKARSSTAKWRAAGTSTGTAPPGRSVMTCDYVNDALGIQEERGNTLRSVANLSSHKHDDPSQWQKNGLEP